MKKTCNYCRAYIPPNIRANVGSLSGGNSGVRIGNCWLGFNIEKLTPEEMKKYSCIPFGDISKFYLIYAKPTEKCLAPRTESELIKAFKKVGMLPEEE